MLPERRLGARGDGDELDVVAARVGDQRLQLDSLTGPGQGKQYVVGSDHAEVAVRGLGRVYEKGWAAGRGKGGRDLLADVAALADAGDDDAAASRAQDAQRVTERPAHGADKSRAQLAEALAFEIERSQRGRDRQPAQLLAAVNGSDFAQRPFSRRHGFVTPHAVSDALSVKSFLQFLSAVQRENAAANCSLSITKQTVNRPSLALFQRVQAFA